MSKTSKKTEVEASAEAERIMTLDGEELLQSLPPPLLAKIDAALAARKAVLPLGDKAPIVTALGIHRTDSGKFVPFMVKIQGETVVHKDVLASGPLPLHLAANVFKINCSRQFMTKRQAFTILPSKQE